MPRKYYIDVVGTIGSGGLTNVATTHTFTAPLTYANGTTLPTLTGTDTFLLSIKNAAGRVEEIVEVTAYNQSSGAATIARAKEGTTAVAHLSGDKVTISIYPSDLIGKVDLSTPLSVAYEGLAYDATNAKLVGSGVPIVRRNVLPDVYVVASQAQKNGFVDPSTVTITPPVGTQVGDVMFISLVGAITATPSGFTVVHTKSDFQPASGYYGAASRVYGKMLDASDYTAGVLNNFTINVTQYSNYTLAVHYVRGLASVPTAGSGTVVTGTVTGATLTLPAMTATRAAPKLMLVAAYTPATLTGGNINVAAAVETPLGTSQNNQYVRAGLIQQNVDAVTTNNTTPAERIDYLTLTVPLTPSGGSSLPPVNVLTDLVDVDLSTPVSVGYEGIAYDAVAGILKRTIVPIVRRSSSYGVTVPYSTSGRAVSNPSWSPTAVAVGDVEVLTMVSVNTLASTPSGRTSIYSASAVNAGYGTGYIRMTVRTLDASDFTGATPNTVNTTQESLSAWTVHYLRGLSAPPAAGDISATNTTTGTYVTPTFSASKAAPKFFVAFHQAFNFTTTTAPPLIDANGTNVESKQSRDDFGHLSMLKTALFQRNAAAVTSPALAGGPASNERSLVVALTPLATTVSKVPVDLVGDLSDVVTTSLDQGDLLYYDATLEQWKNLQLFGASFQTGTTYTAAITDVLKRVTRSNASASTHTIPPNGSVAFRVGTELRILNLGAGAVTITPGSGVTVSAQTGLTLVLAQYEEALLVKTATDTWVRVRGSAVPPGLTPTTLSTKTTTYTAVAGDWIKADATAGAFTITLPSNPYVGAMVTVQKTDATTNVVTVDPTGAGTIHGDLTATLESQWTGATFEHQGSDVWSVVSVHTAATGGGVMPGSVGVLGYCGDTGTQTNCATVSATMADVSASRMVVTFIAPPTGRVMVTLNGWVETNGASTIYNWGLREGSTTVADVYACYAGASARTWQSRETVQIPISGLTPGVSYTWKWAHRLSAGSNSSSLSIGIGLSGMKVEALL